MASTQPIPLKISTSALLLHSLNRPKYYFMLNHNFSIQSCARRGQSSGKNPYLQIGFYLFIYLYVFETEDRHASANAQEAVDYTK